MRLKDHMSPFDEENSHNLFYGLLDHHFARRLLRMVGKAGRERFAEHGWAYGDPSYTHETDPFEVFVYQARVVADTLFAGRLRLQLFYYNCEEPGLEELDESLMDGERFPAPLVERYPYISEAYADFAILVAEITGDEEAIWRLKRALQDRMMPCLHYNPDSDLGANTDPTDHLLLTYDSEMYPEREVIHDGLFETLICAKEDLGDALER